MSEHRTAPGAARQPPPIPDAAGICLFLDVDGTLVEFADHPHAVRVDPSLIGILRSLHRALDGAIALVSGRRIEELDWLLHPLALPSSGLHGAERRTAAGIWVRADLPAEALAAARAQLEAFVAKRQGLSLEDKGTALAIHFRMAPHLEEAAQLAVARAAASLHPVFELLLGNRVIEIKPASHSKATAVESFMREPPFAGRLPIFVGDDVTDHDGFNAVRRHAGMTVGVGERANAEWYLPDPAAARAWLASIASQAGV